MSVLLGNTYVVNMKCVLMKTKGIDVSVHLATFVIMDPVQVYA